MGSFGLAFAKTYNSRSTEYLRSNFLALHTKSDVFLLVLFDFLTQLVRDSRFFGEHFGLYSFYEDAFIYSRQQRIPFAMGAKRKKTVEGPGTVPKQCQSVEFHLLFVGALFGLLDQISKN